MPAIEEAYRANFDTMLRAARNGDLALVDAYDTVEKKPVRIAVAMELDDKEYTMKPFAVMIDGDPYERYLPPGYDLPEGDDNAR